jgi:hypothetical protein
MNKEKWRVYNKLKQRIYREIKRKKKHCPVCTMLLDEEFEKYHKGCPYYEKFIKK